MFRGFWFPEEIPTVFIGQFQFLLPSLLNENVDFERDNTFRYKNGLVFAEHTVQGIPDMTAPRQVRPILHCHCHWEVGMSGFKSQHNITI